MTLYEQILGLPSDKLAQICCSLERGFVRIPKATLELLNSKNSNLIALADEESKFEVWSDKVKQLYNSYCSNIPKHRKYLNFRPLNKNEVDIYSGDSFDYDRLALELYIYFHGIQRDLEWRHSNHFFEVITKGCVVYKRWLLDGKENACFVS